MNQQGALALVGSEDVVSRDATLRLVHEDDSNDHLDARAVASFQRGDSGVFVELYERHFSRIYGYLRVLLRDHYEAEDAAQQTFVKAYQNLGKYELRPGSPFRCWLFRIARNEALSHLRKQGRIQVEQTEKIELRIDGPSAPSVLNWLTDHEVLLFIERLPVAQRQVLAMRYGLSLTTQEAAEVLGRTPVAVRKLEHRALRFLEARLESTGRRGARRAERAAMLVRIRRAPVLGARRFALSGPVMAGMGRPGRW